MNNDKTLEQIAEKVERASRQTDSINPDTFFMSTMDFAKKAEMNEPVWGKVRGDYVDNRVRDEWLSTLVRQEPHLESVLSTSVTFDANRRWRFVGGRNQVLRYARRFDNFDNGAGFRRYQELEAKDYYNADVGAIGEIETDGKNGPLLSLHHVDPTKIRLGKNGLLKYENNDIWQPEWYYRLSSQKSTLDKHNKLGRCAVSRCLKLAQTMIALVTHNLEKLGSLAPNGILFISAEDITQSMWDEAIADRKAVYITNTGNEYFDNLMTVIDRNVSAELVSFSQMPEKFDTFMFTDYMLKGYSLAFNRDVRTFWSLNSGNFGGGTEAALQDEKATYAGAAEFILAFQDQIQRLLPSSLLFEYEVEDTRGKLQKAEVDKVLLESSKVLFDIGLEKEKVFSWLAERGVIPTEWTVENEDVVADMGIVKERSILRQRFLDTEHVQRAIELYPKESIIMYETGGLLQERTKITKLWETGDQAIKRSWNGFDTPGRLKRTTREERISKKKVNIKRQMTIEDYEEGSRGNYMYVAGAYNYLEQKENPTTEEKAVLALLLLLLNQDEITDDEFEEVDNRVKGIIAGSVLLSLYELRKYSDEAEEDSEENYPDRWDTHLHYYSMLGLLWGVEDENTLFIWNRGETSDSCNDCIELDQRILTAREWQDSGNTPGSSNLACGGYCKCDLVPIG